MMWWFFKRKPRPPNNLGQWQMMYTPDDLWEWGFAILHFSRAGIGPRTWFNVDAYTAALALQCGMPIRLMEVL